MGKTEKTELETNEGGGKDKQRKSESFSRGGKAQLSHRDEVMERNDLSASLSSQLLSLRLFLPPTFSISLRPLLPPTDG